MNSSMVTGPESSILDLSHQFNHSLVQESNHDGSRVMDLFAQADALNIQDDNDNDLDELKAFDMHMNRSG